MAFITTSLKLSLSFFILIPLLTNADLNPSPRSYITKNVIDRSWRSNPNWADNRMDLAMCSVGFSGKMKSNRGKSVTLYEVTDSSDHSSNPRVGTLRYGATMIPGKVWITFKSDMFIKLERPVFISNGTTIDGRGADVHIYGSGFSIVAAKNIIIHGLKMHDITSAAAGNVVIPGGQILPISEQDLDAIRIVASRKIWIDHNTLSKAGDGLIDVTLGSTRITISNNRFQQHNKVMLLGHDDSFVEDRKMRVTVMYNHFGPKCHQRMPRIRHGYVHIANNLYQGWDEYAIGGGMNPTILSEGNRFIATSVVGHKAVAWRESGKSWHVKSVGDAFENGAIFSIQASEAQTVARYGPQQRFTVRGSKDIMLLVKDAGALPCRRGTIC